MVLKYLRSSSNKGFAVTGYIINILCTILTVPRNMISDRKQILTFKPYISYTFQTV